MTAVDYSLGGRSWKSSHRSLYLFHGSVVLASISSLSFVQTVEDGFSEQLVSRTVTELQARAVKDQQWLL